MKKTEFSKKICILASFIFVTLGCWMVWKYYNLIEIAIQFGSNIQPDASLPIAGITSIIVPFISYLMYQFKLKNSRNKYGINEYGIPYSKEEDQKGQE